MPPPDDWRGAAGQLQRLLTSHTYDDLGLRLGRVFLFALGMIVTSMIINQASKMFSMTLFNLSLARLFRHRSPGCLRGLATKLDIPLRLLFIVFGVRGLYLRDHVTEHCLRPSANSANRMVL